LFPASLFVDMRFRDDERGVTVQVGAVLLLGIIVISLSIYQVQVVPAQNEQIEFDHSQAVQSDMQQVRNAVLGTAGDGAGDPTAVQLGTRYPARAVFVNPPPVSGSLRTEDAGEIRIENAKAVNPETDDYWRGESAGDTGFDKSFDTDRLVYSADYAVYDNAPTTVYANSVVRNDFETTNAVTLSDQRLIDDRTISLVALDGRLSASRADTVTVDPQAVSASTRTVAVENAGGPVTVTVPTTLSNETWARLLQDERVTNGGAVSLVAVDESADTLTVELQPGVYRLKLAKVGVGTNVAGTSATYLTTVEAPETTTPTTSQQFTVEVRDGYDNPVSGVSVSADVDRGSISAVGSSLSDEDGRVTFEYTAPSGVGDGDVQLRVSYDSLADFDGDRPDDISYTVDVESAGGGGGGASRTDLRVSDFEEGNIGATEWSVGSGSGGVASDTSNSGDDALYVGGDVVGGSDVRTTVDTTGYDRIEVGYWLREGNGGSGPEAQDSNGDEALVVEYRNADNEWVQLDRFNVTEGFPRYERLHELQLSNAFHADFSLRFRQLHGDNGDDRWYVDDVRIVGVGTGGGGGSNSVPTASFDFSPSSPTAGDSVVFDASGSSDSDGSITSYEWDWTNDGTYEGSGETASHTYSSSGTYTVKLRVTDNDGATGTTTQQVDVSSGGGSPPARPQIDVRLDDLTDQRSNNPYYVLSHEVTNTNSSFERVDVRFEPQGSGAGASGSNTAARGSETFDGSYGSGVDYRVIVEAIYTDTNGNEYTAAQRTITDTADGRNPAGNDDLGTASSATLSSSTIQDRSKTQNNRVEYRIDYQVSTGDGFDRVKLAAVNRNENGATTRTDVSKTSRNNYKLRPGDGAGTSYKISILVFDTDGVVVDSRIVVDDADGTDP
jgi:PKD repeat protein